MKHQLLDTLGYRFARGMIGLMQRLPAGTACTVGRFLGSLAYPFTGRRKSAYADLKAAFGSRFSPAQRKRIVKRHFQSIGQSVTEMMHFPMLTRENIERDMDILNREAFDRVVQEGRGVLLLTAHLGNWELLQIVSGIFGSPIHALMQNQKHTRLNDLLNELRRVKGSGVVSTGMGVRELIRALKRGELVGVLGDQSAGKQEGLILPFFGRKTTFPTGAFEIAARTGVPLLPAFIMRLRDEKHQIRVMSPVQLPKEARSRAEFEPVMRDYIRILESLIHEFPEQWLWAKKRWKYSWTKRLVILSDGKPGHVKQARAVAAAFRSVTTQYGREGMEYPEQLIEARYKSFVHRFLFYLAAPFLIPFAQSRTAWLRFFFKPECAAELEQAAGDFFISAGSGMVPLNLFLAEENQAKSIVVMKPPFPYNLFRYDLALVPAHDHGRIPGEAIRTLLAPSSVADQDILETGRQIQAEIRDAAAVKISLFIGGDTGRFRIRPDEAAALVNCLEKTADTQGDYLLTTSRRTSRAVCDYLKGRREGLKACQLLVIASEDKRAGIVENMIELSDLLLVTADSISMISEAVRSRKRVLVVDLDQEDLLPSKHRAFLARLREAGAVVSTGLDRLEETVRAMSTFPASDLVRKEEEMLTRRLQEIL